MGRVTQVVGAAAARLLFTPATVSRVTEHERFRTIQLAGERLVASSWKPGDKLRIRVVDLALRTYTPMSWDQAAGTTELLAYLPGHGPGSEWCDRARVGDQLHVFGPQRSVRLDELAGPPIIVGDETSFGLLLAWYHHQPESPPVGALLEVTDPAVSRHVLDAHGSPPATLCERQPDDGHLAAFEELVVDSVRAHPGAPLCLTGRAQTIATLRRRLKSEPTAGKPATVKAYWDRNRSGLD